MPRLLRRRGRAIVPKRVFQAAADALRVRTRGYSHNKRLSLVYINP